MNYLMKECFRWYGPSDPVSLADIRQCGATGVYSALHHIPYGDVWSRSEIQKRLEALKAFDLEWTAVESVPVSEAIKTQGPDCEQHLENYRQTLINLGAEGIDTVIYNFMPVLDWVRTDMAYRLPNGSECLRFDPVHFAAFEIYLLKREGAESDYTAEQLTAAKSFFQKMDTDERQHFEQSITDVFPGCKLGLSLDHLREMLAAYANIDATQLRANYQHFLESVIPTAEASGVKLAVHPDDPPFSVLGLPRIVSTQADLKAILEMQDSPANGLCYCTGSLGARADNNLATLAKELGHRINAVHLRSVQRDEDGSFHEANHLEGSTSLSPVIEALLRENTKRTPETRLSFRPDHGHRILDDLNKKSNPNPGYDCLGRMKGLAEIRGLQQGIAHLLF